MQGVWIKDIRSGRFSDYPLALSDEWNALWWMVGVQGGLLDSSWLFENDENDAFAADAHAFDPPGSLFNEAWRPGTMQTLAPHLRVDEWSYFCGLAAGDEEEAKRRAHSLEHCFPLSPHPAVKEHGSDILIFDVDDGLLFVWSPHRAWLEAFTARSRDWEPIGSWLEVRSRGW